jgi:hypothetical protein
MYLLAPRAEVTSATIFHFDRSGSAATLYLVKPPVNAVDVVATHASVRPVHGDERILPVRTPDVVAKAFGPLAEGTFVVHHQHDPVRSDVNLVDEMMWLGGPSVVRHRKAVQGCAGMKRAGETTAGCTTRFWRLISFRF